MVFCCFVVADITEEVVHGPETGTRNEVVVVVTREKGNLVSREITEKAIEIVKKLRKHKHHHNNTIIHTNVSK